MSKLPDGWTMEVKTRKTGQKDLFITDPVSGYVFHSFKEVDCFLETRKVGNLALKLQDKAPNNKSASEQILAERTDEQPSRCTIEGTSMPVQTMTTAPNLKREPEASATPLSSSKRLAGLKHSPSSKQLANANPNPNPNANNNFENPFSGMPREITFEDFWIAVTGTPLPVVEEVENELKVEDYLQQEIDDRLALTDGGEEDANSADTFRQTDLLGQHFDDAKGNEDGGLHNPNNRVADDEAKGRKKQPGPSASSG